MLSTLSSQTKALTFSITIQTAFWHVENIEQLDGGRSRKSRALVFLLCRLSSFSAFCILFRTLPFLFSISRLRKRENVFDLVSHSALIELVLFSQLLTIILDTEK